MNDSNEQSTGIQEEPKTEAQLKELRLLELARRQQAILKEKEEKKAEDDALAARKNAVESGADQYENKSEEVRQIERGLQDSGRDFEEYAKLSEEIGEFESFKEKVGFSIAEAKKSLDEATKWLTKLTALTEGIAEEDIDPELKAEITTEEEKINKTEKLIDSLEEELETKSTDHPAKEAKYHELSQIFGDMSERIKDLDSFFINHSPIIPKDKDGKKIETEPVEQTEELTIKKETEEEIHRRNAEKWKPLEEKEEKERKPRQEFIKNCIDQAWYQQSQRLRSIGVERENFEAQVIDVINDFIDLELKATKKKSVTELDVNNLTKGFTLAGAKEISTPISVENWMRQSGGYSSFTAEQIAEKKPGMFMGIFLGNFAGGTYKQNYLNFLVKSREGNMEGQFDSNTQTLSKPENKKVAAQAIVDMLPLINKQTALMYGRTINGQYLGDPATKSASMSVQTAIQRYRGSSYRDSAFASTKEGW